MLQTAPSVIPSRTASPSLTQSLQQEAEKLRRLSNARATAGKILNSYPDYAKATPGYTAAVIEAVASYSDYVQERLRDPVRGVQAVCKFLPAVNEVVEMADRFAADEREAAKPRVQYRIVERVSEPHRPFPQLWKAFGNEFMDAKLLEFGARSMRDRSFNPFDRLESACKILVAGSRDAALSILEGNLIEMDAA